MKDRWGFFFRVCCDVVFALCLLGREKHLVYLLIPMCLKFSRGGDGFLSVEIVLGENIRVSKVSLCIVQNVGFVDDYVVQ